MSPTERLRRHFLWGALIAITVLAVVLQRIRPDDGGALQAARGADEAESVVEGVDGGVEGGDSDEDADAALAPVSREAALAGKVVVALHTLLPDTPPDQLLTQAEPLRQGVFAERVGYAIVVGKISGWSNGLAELEEIPLPEEAIDEARALRERVHEAMQALADADGGEVASEELDALEPTLGYFSGVLGPDAEQGALSTVAALLFAAGWYLTVFLAGLVSIAVLGVMLIVGRLRPRYQPAGTAHASLVLGETFLVWMLLFLVLQVVAGFIGEPFAERFGGDAALLLSLAAMFGSLGALAYPALRGISWRELRESVGLHAGRGIAREAAAGLLCYVTAVPMLAVGLVVYAILTWIARSFDGAAEPPSHPVVDLLSEPTAFRILMLFMLASVAAPIVEEIAFRGLLYGHLRGTVAPRLRLLSVLIAAVVSSVVFAIIHPQGVLFVPALGGLAVGFCIFRELRGSLVAPMVAHGINNAVTLTIGLTLMS